MTEHKFPKTSDCPTHLNCLECDSHERTEPYYLTNEYNTHPPILRGHIYYCSDARVAGIKNWLGGLGAVNAVPIASTGCRMMICPRFDLRARNWRIPELKPLSIRQIDIYDLLGDTG